MLHRSIAKVRGAFAAAAFMAVATPALAIPIEFHAALSGAAEAPPNSSAGTGTARVILDTAAHTLQIIASFSGLNALTAGGLPSGTTQAHVHCCTAVPGAGTVGVATELPLFTGFPTGVRAGSYDHTFDASLASTWSAAYIAANGGTPLSAEAAFFAGVAAGRAYLNIHTNAFPGGEIRGFLVPEPGSLALIGLALTGLAGLRLQRRSV